MKVVLIYLSRPGRGGQGPETQRQRKGVAYANRHSELAILLSFLKRTKRMQKKEILKVAVIQQRYESAPNTSLSGNLLKKYVPLSQVVELE